jgi:hypothetical protein
MNRIKHFLGSEAPGSSSEAERQKNRGEAGSAEADRVRPDVPASGDGATQDGQSLLCRLRPADPQIRRSLFRR